MRRERLAILKILIQLQKKQQILSLRLLLPMLLLLVQRGHFNNSLVSQDPHPLRQIKQVKCFGV